jgi:hypothetical protein
MTWKRPNRPPVIDEADASPGIAEVYTEIRSLLRVPQVPLLFQMYAGHGGFLEQFWQAVKPVLRTRAFAGSAIRLSADAYTRMYNYFDIDGLASGALEADSALPEITRTVEAFQLLDAAWLLLLSFAAEAFDNPVGTTSASLEEADWPPSAFSPATAEAKMSAPTARILDEARRQSGVGVVPGELRALAAWPDFLDHCWRNWKRTAESPLLSACENQLLLHAIELAHGLPGPLELSFAALRDSGLEEEDFSSVVRLTQHWNRAYARQLLQVSMAKIALEDGSGAARMRQEAQKREAEKNREKETKRAESEKKQETPTRAA